MEHGKSFLSQGYIRELFLKNGLTILNIYLPTYRISQKMLQIHKSFLQLHRSVYELVDNQIS